jgi:hypothetical protein
VYTRVAQASAEGQLKAVELLMASGADINPKDRFAPDLHLVYT